MSKETNECEAHSSSDSNTSTPKTIQISTTLHESPENPPKSDSNKFLFEIEKLNELLENSICKECYQNTKIPVFGDMKSTVTII